MVRTRRLWVALRGPSLPQSGHGALAGAQRTVMVRTGGLRVSMACVLRWAWVCTHQHAGRNFLCQVPFERGGTWSGSARSVKNKDSFRPHFVEDRKLGLLYRIMPPTSEHFVDAVNPF